MNKILLIEIKEDEFSVKINDFIVPMSLTQKDALILRSLLRDMDKAQIKPQTVELDPKDLKDIIDKKIPTLKPNDLMTNTFVYAAPMDNNITWEYLDDKIFYPDEKK